MTEIPAPGAPLPDHLANPDRVTLPVAAAPVLALVGAPDAAACEGGACAVSVTSGRS